ncbi:MAG: polymer-forming cytoskeletal protein [Butyrivibrio sp.]|nr:polymer-forming cytoskeletal protein [Butyrivibrio sp.]
MFGVKKDTNVDPTLEQVGTILGPGSVLDGPLKTNDSTRIDGTVNGDVTVTGSLIVGQEGKITGAVSSLNAYIAGEITGNISSPQGKVEISDTGKVIGDVACKSIIIDENAVFQGQCDMTGVEKPAASAAPEQKEAESGTENASDSSEKSSESSTDNSSES